MPTPLHAAWRMTYIRGPKPPSDACIFCGIREASLAERRERLVLCAADRAFVMLNRWPYAPGHLLVMPHAHVGLLEQLEDADHDALFRLVREAARRLRAATGCPGMNLGVNAGKCAGASFEEHLHVQLVPRWPDDHNFMAVTADTRVIPQALDATFAELAPHFADVRSD
jgi:ATP adenylyltransferase